MMNQMPRSSSAGLDILFFMSRFTPERNGHKNYPSKGIVEALKITNACPEMKQRRKVNKINWHVF